MPVPVLRVGLPDAALNAPLLDSRSFSLAPRGSTCPTFFPRFPSTLAIHVLRGYFPAMLAIRLKPEMEERLARLAARTGRTKTFYVREAIAQHLEDLEDYYLAADAARNPGRIFKPDEAKRELGL